MSYNLFQSSYGVSTDPYHPQAIIEHVRRRAEGGGGLSELLSGLAEPAESREWRVRILHPDFKTLGGQVGCCL